MTTTKFNAEISKGSFAMYTKQFDRLEDLMIHLADTIEDMSIDAVIEIRQIDIPDDPHDMPIVSHYKFYDLYQLKDDVKELSLI